MTLCYVLHKMYTEDLPVKLNIRLGTLHGKLSKYAIKIIKIYF